MKKLLELTIRKKNAIYADQKIQKSPADAKMTATFLTEAANYGYSFSKEAIEYLSTKPQLMTSLLKVLAQLKGAKQHKPMYPGFPRQVMDMSDLALYGNAFIHYITFGELLPYSESSEEAENTLLDIYQLKELSLIKTQQLKALSLQLFQSQEAFSSSDKEDLNCLLKVLGQPTESLTISIKENLAFAVKLFKEQRFDLSILSASIKTATDVLRIAVALSDGDISLAQPPYFISFNRSTRKFLLNALNQAGNIKEDMQRHTGYFIRLGEKLHPSEYRARYPRAAAGFDAIRNNEKVCSFNRKVELAMTKDDLAQTIQLLQARPGEYARRLDYLLRFFQEADQQQLICHGFKQIAAELPAKMLLTLRTHFGSRTRAQNTRVFFPKGQTAKVFAAEEQRAPISKELAGTIQAICQQALTGQFAQKSYLGKVYVDEKLRNYAIPFANRSAAKALHAVARGSRLSLNEHAAYLRLFIYWQGNGIDIDSSVMLFKEDFRQVSYCSYYQLRDTLNTMVHSGDIVSAPNGASEFIDIDLQKAEKYGARYAVFSINSYSQIPYCDLSECFAGVMERDAERSGKLFEPKSVKQKFDLTSDLIANVPFIIDLQQRELIWCDLGLTRDISRSTPNNIHQQLTGLEAVTFAMSQLEKPTLYDLFTLHAEARGERTSCKEEAVVIFSPYEESFVSPEDFACILSDYL